MAGGVERESGIGAVVETDRPPVVSDSLSGAKEVFGVQYVTEPDDPAADDSSQSAPEKLALDVERPEDEEFIYAFHDGEVWSKRAKGDGEFEEVPASSQFEGEMLENYQRVMRALANGEPTAEYEIRYAELDDDSTEAYTVIVHELLEDGRVKISNYVKRVAKAVDESLEGDDSSSRDNDSDEGFSGDYAVAKQSPAEPVSGASVPVAPATVQAPMTVKVAEAPKSQTRSIIAEAIEAADDQPWLPEYIQRIKEPGIPRSSEAPVPTPATLAPRSVVGQLERPAEVPTLFSEAMDRAFEASIAGIGDKKIAEPAQPASSETHISAAPEPLTSFTFTPEAAPIATPTANMVQLKPSIVRPSVQEKPPTQVAVATEMVKTTEVIKASEPVVVAEPANEYIKLVKDKSTRPIAEAEKPAALEAPARPKTQEPKLAAVTIEQSVAVAPPKPAAEPRPSKPDGGGGLVAEPKIVDSRVVAPKIIELSQSQPAQLRAETAPVAIAAPAEAKSAPAIEIPTTQASALQAPARKTFTEAPTTIAAPVQVERVASVQAERATPILARVEQTAPVLAERVVLAQLAAPKIETTARPVENAPARLEPAPVKTEAPATTPELSAAPATTTEITAPAAEAPAKLDRPTESRAQTAEPFQIQKPSEAKVVPTLKSTSQEKARPTPQLERPAIAPEVPVVTAEPLKAPAVEAVQSAAVVEVVQSAPVIEVVQSTLALEVAPVLVSAVSVEVPVQAIEATPVAIIDSITPRVETTVAPLAEIAVPLDVMPAPAETPALAITQEATPVQINLAEATTQAAPVESISEAPAIVATNETSGTTVKIAATVTSRPVMQSPAMQPTRSVEPAPFQVESVPAQAEPKQVKSQPLLTQVEAVPLSAVAAESPLSATQIEVATQIDTVAVEAPAVEVASITVRRQTAPVRVQPSEPARHVAEPRLHTAEPARAAELTIRPEPAATYRAESAPIVSLEIPLSAATSTPEVAPAAVEPPAEQLAAQSVRPGATVSLRRTAEPVTRAISAPVTAGSRSEVYQPGLADANIMSNPATIPAFRQSIETGLFARPNPVQPNSQPTGSVAQASDDLDISIEVEDGPRARARRGRRHEVTRV